MTVYSNIIIPINSNFAFLCDLHLTVAQAGPGCYHGESHSCNSSTATKLTLGSGPNLSTQLKI